MDQVWVSFGPTLAPATVQCTPSRSIPTLARAVHCSAVAPSNALPMPRCPSNPATLMPLRGPLLRDAAGPWARLTLGIRRLSLNKACPKEFVAGSKGQWPEGLQWLQAALARAGFSAKSQTIGPPTQHPAHADFGEGYSSFSDDWYKLNRGSWFYIDVECAFKDGSGKVVAPEITSSTSWFHGTTWGVAIKILQEGFRVGEGTHRKNNRSCQGVWCTGSVGDSATRCDTSRYLQGIPDEQRDSTTRGMACPVVLQFSMESSTPTDFGSGKHCFEFGQGVLVPGFKATRIHFNKTWCENWMAQDKYVGQLEGNPYYWRQCGCLLCGAVLQGPSDPLWFAWRRSNTGKYYHPTCGYWKNRL